MVVARSETQTSTSFPRLPKSHEAFGDRRHWSALASTAFKGGDPPGGTKGSRRRNQSLVESRLLPSFCQVDLRRPTDFPLQYYASGLNYLRGSLNRTPRVRGYPSRYRLPKVSLSTRQLSLRKKGRIEESLVRVFNFNIRLLYRKGPLRSRRPRTRGRENRDVIPEGARDVSSH